MTSTADLRPPAGLSHPCNHCGTTGRLLREYEYVTGCATCDEAHRADREGPMLCLDCRETSTFGGITDQFHNDDMKEKP